ncbi:RluA family pseudouridine synthase [Psychrobacter frigidicola]|uniref:Ribosomal large subunit pseudouridine synthase D n=2 Tax=Psychrobacter frigidicola TaxID=45611 RepID=A0A5C7A588_9GAMM|nr:RluA family pseudouridine synthase [Psychrobacter frigidicola]TXD98581.1 RluA family pseudouridine synthase [Psychrobacter frigidicola]
MIKKLPPNQSSDTPLSAQLSAQNPSDQDENQPEGLMAEPLASENEVLDDDDLYDESLNADELSFDDDLLDDDEDDAQDDALTEVRLAVPEEIDVSHTATDKESGLRIDKLASQVFTDFSRAQLQGWISDGSLLCNGSAQKPKYRVKIGDVLHLTTILQQHSEDLPEDIDIDVVYEDDAVLVINKPVGMVVHPGAGNQTGTLVNALLYHYPQQHHLPRAGLVHRIDKDTSGLLLIGKTKPAQMALMAQLKDKSVYRHYQCVVAGDEASLMRHRRIDAPIGRHRNQRTKMTVMTAGRDAVTHLLSVTPLNDNYCLLDVGLETGRTHQIRVHLSHITYPIVGDRVYGGRRQLRAGLTEAQRQAIGNFPRQALHAYALGFVHPTTGEDVEVTTPIPEDMQKLIAVLNDGYDLG